MLKSERQSYIENIINQNGRVIVTEMAKELDVTEDTIRKDLTDMNRKGLVKRVHGGAVSIEKEIPELAKRTDRFIEEKKQLVEKALGLLKPNMSIFIDGGTTNILLAESLPYDYRGSIITNNPLIPVKLVSHPHLEISLVGGVFDKASQITFGSAACQEIQNLHVDICFVGLSSIDTKYGITVGSHEESIIKREILKSSSICVGMVTREKIGKLATFTVGEANLFDYLVFEEGTSPTIYEQFEELGIKVL